MRLVIVLAIIFLILFAFSRTSTQTSVEGFDETIFLSVAAFRDAECLATVQDAFAKATRPDRVFVGICQQNKEIGEDCVQGLDAKYAKQIRSIDLKHTEAKGPTWARYLCSTLYNNEDYFLQIDSHTSFVDGWDDKLITDLKKCPSAKSILTHYPHAHDANSSTMQNQLPVMCRSRWTDDGLPTFEAVMQPIKDSALRRVPFVAGGMVFAPGSLIRQVPFDDGLDFLFAGEEILLSARFFTHGWDVFTPSQNVVKHHYERKNSPKFWTDISGYRNKQLVSVERVKRLLGLLLPPIMHDRYGMGSVRSLQEFWDFSGLDPEKKSSKSGELFCGR